MGKPTMLESAAYSSLPRPDELRWEIDPFWPENWIRTWFGQLSERLRESNLYPQPNLSVVSSPSDCHSMSEQLVGM